MVAYPVLSYLLELPGSFLETYFFCVRQKVFLKSILFNLCNVKSPCHKSTKGKLTFPIFSLRRSTHIPVFLRHCRIIKE